MRIAHARSLLKEAITIDLDPSLFIGKIGVVYLIHLDRRLGHAGHYIGWSQDPAWRLVYHARGQGANFMRCVGEAGISWRVAQVFTGVDRYFERWLKDHGGASKYCPICAGRTVITAAPANWQTVSLPKVIARHPYIRA